MKNEIILRREFSNESEIPSTPNCTSMMLYTFQSKCATKRYCKHRTSVNSRDQSGYANNRVNILIIRIKCDQYNPAAHFKFHFVNNKIFCSHIHTKERKQRHLGMRVFPRNYVATAACQLGVGIMCSCCCLHQHVLATANNAMPVVVDTCGESNVEGTVSRCCRSLWLVSLLTTTTTTMLLHIGFFTVNWECRYNRYWKFDKKGSYFNLI